MAERPSPGRRIVHNADKRDKVSVTRISGGAKTSTTSKVAGQRVEATMKVLLEASSRKPVRTVKLDSTSPTCESKELKEELMELKRQGLASARSNSQSSINSTQSCDGSRPRSTGLKQSPIKKASTNPSGVRKTKMTTSRNVTIMQKGSTASLQNQESKKATPKSGVTKVNGVNANTRSSQESLSASRTDSGSKTDIMSSILKDWEDSKKDGKKTTGTAGKQIKRELSDLKDQDTKNAKKAGSDASSGSSSETARPRLSAAARAAQLKKESNALRRQEAAKKMAATTTSKSSEKTVTSVSSRTSLNSERVTSSTSSSTSSARVTSSKSSSTSGVNFTSRVVKRESSDLQKSDISKTNVNVVKTNSKTQVNIEKKEKVTNGPISSSRSNSSKQIKSEFKSVSVKGTGSSMLDVLGKSSNSFLSTSQVTKLSTTSNLSYSDFQNQNYIESCNSSESEKDSDNMDPQTRNHKILGKKKPETLNLNEKEDSDGEIGLGIPYSILRMSDSLEKTAKEKPSKTNLDAFEADKKKQSSSFLEIEKFLTKNGGLKLPSVATGRSFGSSNSIKEDRGIKEQESSDENSENLIDFDVEKLSIIEPVDYEHFLTTKKSQLNNDPLRLMLVFPHDDVSASTIPRQLRTVRSTVPEAALREIKNEKVAESTLFVRECINSYTTEWRVINHKYADYSGDFHELPCYSRTVQLKDQKFEVDEDPDEKGDEDSLLSPSGNIVKKGFLYKTPFGNRNESMRIIVTFKRRFFFLKQLQDKSFLLEYFKDEKSSEAKGTLYLDSLVDVVKTSKTRKNGLELRMQDNTVHMVAAESEREMEEWYTTFKKVIESQKSETNSDKQSLSSMDDELDHEYADDAPSLDSEKLHKSHLENSRHLQKYSKESERTNAQKRGQDRQKLFNLYYRMQATDRTITVPDPKPYEEEFGKRFILEIKELKFRLSALLNSNGEPTELIEDISKASNVEPFFVTLALFDAQNNRKISEDFHIDINPTRVREMLDSFRDIIINGASSPTSGGGKMFIPPTLPDVSGLDENWMKYPQKGIFSVKKANAEIYAVIRIEKILQGNIASCAEPYVKPGGDTLKLCQKVNKQAKIFSSRMSQYRMPFAWAAKPLFKENGAIYPEAKFTPIFRQESSKLTDEDLLKNLQEYRRNPDKPKLQEIPGYIKLQITPYQSQPSNSLTSSLVPTMPWPEKPQDPPVLEVEEFPPDAAKLSHPHTTYTNNLYVYPLSLKFDSQKAFTKARNIAVCLELRDSDDDGAVPLKCFYGRCGTSIFTAVGSAAVLHHQTIPDFYEEIKIALPTKLHNKHHLFFRFYHVSCETGKGTVKKRDTVDSFVGYAWMPILLNKGQLSVGERTAAVAASLPAGYLSASSSSSGSKSPGPDVKWVDGGKEILKVNLKLKSTIYTEDQHLHNFFITASKPEGSTDKPLEMIQCIKAMHAVRIHVFIEFLPIILNKLFSLIPIASMDEVQINIVRLIIFIISQVHDEGREDVLHSYVKYVFETERFVDTKKTVHEELVKNLAASLRPSTDFLVIKSLMKHLWFFFDILIKSMAQYLIMTDKLGSGVPRHQKFSSNFETGVRTLVQVLVPHILQKSKDHVQEAKEANYHLAHFIKNCFTYMDRGFVFRLLNCYLDNFSPEDNQKSLYEMKFEMLRVVCSHEHYIALNLPIQKKGIASKNQIKNAAKGLAKKLPLRYGKDQFKDIKYDYALTEEYCKEHFLAGLLLREVGFSLTDTADVRQVGIRVLRNLLAKHSFDDRYSSKQHQSRIASLYLPMLSIILDNVPRLIITNSLIGPSLSLGNNSQFDSEGGSQDSGMGHERSNSIGGSRKTMSLQRDSTVFDMIAGRGLNTTGSEVVLRQHNSDRKPSSYAHRLSWLGLSGSPALPSISGPKQLSDYGLSGSSGSINNSANEKALTNGALTNSPSLEMDRSDSQNKGHRNKSLAVDKFLPHEVKDLLMCLLYIIKNVNEEVMLAWWSQAGEEDLLKFFDLMELCVQHFRYQGKKAIWDIKTKEKQTTPFDERAQTLPAIGRKSQMVRIASIASPLPTALTDAEITYRVIQDANLSTEVGIIILDVLGCYCSHFKHGLDVNDGDNQLMKKVMDIHLSFLRVSQSEVLLSHAFASIRILLNRFPISIFKGSTTICGDICLVLLKNMNSKIISTRTEACALLYILMRSNYEHTGKREFNRTTLQVIVAVAKLIGETNSVRFQEALATINNYANTDKTTANTHFPSLVKELTKKIRSVLMATAQMKEHENNPEVLVDLQYSLAKSYATTPELRRTWLESMANIHINHGNYSEAAHCHIHSAALIAEFLKKKGLFQDGFRAFKNISPNIENDERGVKLDEGLDEIQYSEEILLQQLEKSAELLRKAERYETMDEVYKHITHFYKKQRDFNKLALAYGELSKSFEKVAKVQGTGKRLLGQYFRVKFFGQHFEEDHGKEFIYKEPKVTNLTSICERLEKMYQDRFGADAVKMIRDSIEPDNLDPKFAYIQVTFVKPYFDENELLDRVTEYERSNNIRRFVFETPYTKGGKARGAVEDQYLRKTILTTESTFPYVKKRINVLYHHQIELTPIQVASEELNSKISDLENVIASDVKDMKKLQLLLQGSVSVQVNAGPQAYAAAFFGSQEPKYKTEHVTQLKTLFRDFLRVCGLALQINSTLIKEDQFPYHEDLENKYGQMSNAILELMGEKQLADDELDSPSKRRASTSIFNAISGTP